jgi:hypothetical protein
MSYEKMRLHLEEVISRLGMAVQPVFPTATTPPFAYSVGQHAKGLPELIVFGLHPEVSAGLLYELAAHMEREQADGRTVGPGTVSLDGCLLDTVLVEVPAEVACKYATQAHDRSDSKATFLQAVWPDRAGLFPWQPGYDPAFSKYQPVVGTPPDGAAGAGYVH